MLPGNPSTVRHRAWPQRLVLSIGTSVVVVCAMAAMAIGYFGVRFAQIDRVGGIKVAAAPIGEPANYLLVGTDSRQGLDPDAVGFTEDGVTGCDCTDTIMLLRVDPKTKAAQVLSFPRDLWVPIAGTGKSARINSAHAEGEQALIDTIEQNFNMSINHYVEIDFVGFEKLVNAVGGIPLWFDAPVRDRHTGLDVSAAACQVLDGEQARKFVRSRYLEYKGSDGKWHSDPTADLGRITRQQVFIRRAIHKAVSKGLTNPATLNQLVSAGVQNVRLDSHLSAGDMVSLGRRFANFNSQDLIGYSIPSEGFFTAAGADVQRPLMRQAEPILNIFRGLPPGTISPSSIDVEVRNGSGISGQGNDAAAALKAIGFVITKVTTTAGGPVAHTTVLFGKGDEAAAHRVAAHITGGAPLVLDPRSKAGQVVVVTGADLTTIHGQPAPEGSPDDLRSTTSTTTTTAVPGAPSTTASPTTSTTMRPAGYSTGEPPPGVKCG